MCISACLLRGLFSCKSPLLSNPKVGFDNSPPQGAFTARTFRSLRRASKGSAFGIRHLLKKVDENFLTFSFNKESDYYGKNY